jgi:hypothetical protein
MPENDSLDALLRKGDPATGMDTGSEARYARLLPGLDRPCTPTPPPQRRGLWLPVPSVLLVAIVGMLLRQSTLSPVPMPVASPSPIVTVRNPPASPPPVARVVPAPVVSAARKNLSRRVRKKRVHLASAPRPRLHRRRVARIRHHPKRAEPVEHIVIERSVIPPPPVAIVIVGDREKLTVTRPLLEENS